MKDVEVYRLFADGTWDLTVVSVPNEPWNVEVVESRACQAAWLAARNCDKKIVRMGLFTVVTESDPL